MEDSSAITSKHSVWWKVIIPLIIAGTFVSIFLGRWIILRSDLPKIDIPKRDMPSPNAYDVFVNAGKMIVDRDLVGYAFSRKHKLRNQYDREYSLREKKQLVDKNAGAIEKLKSGFDQPYLSPPVRTFDRTYPQLVNFRAMGRLLYLKSQVLKSENRWLDAADCDLDILEMGAMCPHGGSLVHYLTGVFLATIGQRDLPEIVDHLNAQETKRILKRYTKIRKMRGNLIDNFHEEKYSLLASLYSVSLDGEKLSRVTDSPFGHSDDDHSRPELTADIMKIGKRKIVQNILGYYDDCDRYLNKPYDSHRPEPVVPPDPVSNIVCPVVEPIYLKEAAMMSKDNLLYLTLALHAYKLDFGEYPKNLTALIPKYIPDVLLDPFARNLPLHYIPNRKKYLLYSVGPDGNDDGGTPLKEGIPDDNAKSGLPRLKVDTRDIGDIVAGVND